VRISGSFSERYLGTPAPMLSVDVSLAFTRTTGAVEFLIDSGASRTVIHPSDAASLGVDLASLAPTPHSVGRGTGGVSSYREEPASLRFASESGPTPALDVPIWIALPGSGGQLLPSLLGRDVLSFFTVTLDWRAPLVALDCPDDLFGVAP
jgi:hypothetical protein